MVYSPDFIEIPETGDTKDFTDHLKQKNRDVIWDNICTERDVQDARFGGPDHDDKHKKKDWLKYIEKHTEIAWDNEDQDYRYQLIRIAALAVAAIESFDRKTKIQ